MARLITMITENVLDKYLAEHVLSPKNRRGEINQTNETENYLRVARACQQLLSISAVTFCATTTATKHFLRPLIHVSHTLTLEPSVVFSLNIFYFSVICPQSIFQAALWFYHMIFIKVQTGCSVVFGCTPWLFHSSTLTLTRERSL